MQPLARVVPRLFLDSIASSKSRRPLRISYRPFPESSTCLQCKILIQTRRFADSQQPPPTSNGSKSSSDAPPTLRSSNTVYPSSSSDHHEPPISDEPPANLPSTLENRRLAVTKRFSTLMDHMQGNIFIASQRINDLTGYSGIEALKQRITALEKRVSDSQELVRSSRLRYKTTVADRAATQREVTGLLARKDTWTPADLERFTALYRMDHSNEQAVQEAATRLADAEREAEHAAGKLSSSILSRYHEEQIWSDKIRRMSTWGTWGLMGVNALLFLVFQFGLEPWRRRRLVRGFEEKVKQALEEEKIAAEMRRRAGETTTVEAVPLEVVLTAGIQEIEEELEAGAKDSEPAIDAVVDLIKGEREEPEVAEEAVASLDIAELHVPATILQLRRPETWVAAAQEYVHEHLSEKRLEMRKKDITIIALESFATGSAIAVIIVSLLLRHS